MQRLFTNVNENDYENTQNTIKFDILIKNMVDYQLNELNHLSKLY